jgi:four helix bundle protein
MRRAAVSIPSDISGGQARRRTKEFQRFLALASGSLAELETQLLLTVYPGYTKLSEAFSLQAEIAEIQKMIASIQRKLALRQWPVVCD